LLAGQAYGNAVGVDAPAELEDDVAEDEEVVDMSIFIELLGDESIDIPVEDELDVVVVVVIVVEMDLPA